MEAEEGDKRGFARMKNKGAKAEEEKDDGAERYRGKEETCSGSGALDRMAFGVLEAKRARRAEASEGFALLKIFMVSAAYRYERFTGDLRQRTETKKRRNGDRSHQPWRNW